MNIIRHSYGSVILETLISIVILGLIAIGSFYSYSFVYQRIISQRHKRIALSVLQDWMERTRSSVLNPNDSRGEDYFRRQFESEIPSRFYPNNIHIDPNEISITSDIEINPMDDNMNMTEIKIWVNLSNNNEATLSENGLQITLYTRVYQNQER